MTIRRTWIALSFFVFVAACGGADESRPVPEAQPAGATNADIGDHVVHFSALLTNQLPPEVARTYNIVRSDKRAMLNVSVLSESDGTAVTARVTVKTVNLAGQPKDVTMRRINEQEAIYYIGETDVYNRETLIFDISVTPDGVESASDVRFKRQFFSD